MLTEGNMYDKNDIAKDGSALEGQVATHTIEHLKQLSCKEE
jgi:hypothetical protein